jgi:hypothetical protein
MLIYRIVKGNSNYMTVALIVLILSLVFVSCSFILNGNKGDDHKKGDETFTFYSGENQDKYEAIFSDDELKSLSKNGKLLSRDEMKENEDLVYDKLNDLGNKFKREDEENFVFHFNGKEFREHMKQFSEDMRLFKPHILKEIDSLHFDFDTAAFNKNMRELKSNLAPLKKMKIKILKDLDNDLDIPDIEMDEKDFNIDMEGINKELEKTSRSPSKAGENKNFDLN